MMEGKYNYRISVQASLIFEASIIIGSMLLGYILFPRWEEIWLAPIIVFIYLLICTAPLAVIKGFDFSLHDVEGGFPWVFYHFCAIFIATFLAPFFDTALYTFVGELKSG